MTDPVSLALLMAATVVAVALGLLVMPRPPVLDGERWFKIALATVLRGRIDADRASEEAWREALLRFVPYHPAGRFPERKVVDPASSLLGRSALPGERGLVEALMGLQGRPARWARMYDEDEVALAARSSDPNDLGPDYDPGRCVPGLTWEALAAWGGGDAAFRDRLLERLGARWMLVGQDRVHAGLDEVFATELGDRAVRVDPGDAEPTAVVAARALELVSEPGDRLVLVGFGAGAVWLLGALTEQPTLRDRSLLLLAVGAPLLGFPGTEGPLSEKARRDWMGAWFRHSTLDTEVIRAFPYFSVQWLDRVAEPPGVKGLPLSHQRFPEPPDEGAQGVVALVHPEDLGVLPADRDLPLSLVSRALVATVSMWVLRHAG